MSTNQYRRGMRGVSKQALIGVPGESAAVVAYAGIGDTAGFTSGGMLYGGLRAFNASKAAALQPLIDVTDQAGGNAATFACKSSGYLDLAAVSAWVSERSVTSILVTKVYEQIIGNHFLASASRPTLLLNQVGGLPAIDFNGSNNFFVTQSDVGAQATPLHFVHLCYATSAVAGELSSSGSFGLQNYIFSGSGTFRQGDASDVDTAVGISRDAWHSIQSLWKGAAGSIKVDSAAPVTVTGNPGTTGFGGTTKWTIGAGTQAGGVPFGGKQYEFMVFAGAPSATDQGLLNANQHAIGSGF